MRGKGMPRKTKGVYKRGKIWWITYTDCFGKQYWKSSRSESRADALYALNLAHADAKVGKEPGILEQIRRNAARHSFSSLCEKYKEFCQNNRDAKNRNYMIDQLKAEFGKRLLKSISLADLESYQSRLLNSGLQAATVNRRIACLKHMLHKATDWDMLDNESYLKIRKVQLLKEENTRLRFLNVEEVRRLLFACRPYLRPIVTMALNTGMRRGEILGLTWDRVDLKHGFILLGDNNVKSGRGRQIPINKVLMATLKPLYLKRSPEVPYLFPTPSGKPYATINTAFKKACDAAGIKDFHFHDLRHTFASQAVMNGADLASVQKLLGHSTITMTMRYSHLSQNHLSKTVDLLGELFNGRKGAYSG